MMTEDQQELLLTIAGTVSSLAVKCIKDPVALGSVSTFAVALSSLLSDSNVGSHAYSALRTGFSYLPPPEEGSLSVLFGSCLTVCSLAVEFDEDVAVSTSSELYRLWKVHSTPLELN